MRGLKDAQQNGIKNNVWQQIHRSHMYENINQTGFTFRCLLDPFGLSHSVHYALKSETNPARCIDHVHPGRAKGRSVPVVCSCLWLLVDEETSLHSLFT